MRMVFNPFNLVVVYSLLLVSGSTPPESPRTAALFSTRPSVRAFNHLFEQVAIEAVQLLKGDIDIDEQIWYFVPDSSVVKMIRNTVRECLVQEDFSFGFEGDYLSITFVINNSFPLPPYTGLATIYCVRSKCEKSVDKFRKTLQQASKTADQNPTIGPVFILSRVLNVIGVRWDDEYRPIFFAAFILRNAAESDDQLDNMVRAKVEDSHLIIYEHSGKSTRIDLTSKDKVILQYITAAAELVQNPEANDLGVKVRRVGLDSPDP